MKEMLAAQRDSFMVALPEPLSVRKDRLKRAAAMIRDHAERFCDALSEDFGHRSREQSMITDIGGSIGPIDHALKNLDKWAKPEKRGVQFPLNLLGAKAWVEYQPKGVIGVIGPTRMPYGPVVALVNYAASRAAALAC